MQLGIEGRVAMVAAASKGIGKAIAMALANEGCHVSICARSEEELERTGMEIAGETRTYVVDVTSAEDLEWWVQQTREDLGDPSILITNTGGPPAGSINDMTDEQWQSGFDSTLMNVVRLVRAVAPTMSEAKWGRIVHVSSLVAKDPSQLLPISSTLRSGLMALTKIQARELAPHGITVNGVLPGHTLTARQFHLSRIRGEREGISSERALELQAEEVPMKRLATPEEIASVVAFLCGRPAAYLTGQSIAVDGGLSGGIG